MKQIIIGSLLSLSIIIVIFYLLTPKYKYTIRGKVYIPTSGVNGTHVFTWHCDSVFFIGDTICYISNDGGLVKIAKPYHIIQNY